MDCGNVKRWLLCMFSLAALFLICCYLWAHLEAGRINTDEDMKQIYIPDSGAPCKIQITNESARVLEEYFDDPDDLIMYLNIDFDNETLVNKSMDNDVVLPLRWIWTYGKGLDYLNWPQEYFIWSFGLLNSQTPDIPVTFKVIPAACSMHFGHLTTTVLVASALSETVERYLHPKPKHFKGSTWCYTTVIKDSNADTLVRNFGYFVGQFGYRCCNVSNNFLTCFDQIRRPDQIYTYIPFYIAFIAMVISPLFYSYIWEWFWAAKDQSMLEQRDGYINLDEQWIFFGKRSPISFISYTVSFIGSKCPEWLSKAIQFLLKLLSLVLIFPACIYVKLFIYQDTKHVYAYLVDKIQHNLPVGFSSMLFPFECQSRNFLTLTWGPCIMFTVFSVLSLVYLFLDEFVSKDENAKKCAVELLGLDTDWREGFCKVIISNMNTVLRMSTWVGASESVSKTVSNIFNAVPLIFTFRLIISRIVSYWNLGLVFSFLVTMTTGTACCYALFAYCAIFIASFEFLTLIITFLYMAVVKSPDVTGGYIALVIGLVYIIVSSLRYPAHKYLRFLKLATESLKYMANVEIASEIRDTTLNLIYFEPHRIKQYALIDDDDRPQCVLVRNTLVVRSRQAVDTFCINGIDVKLTRNEDVIRNKSCLKYENGKLAIRKDLFVKLVDELQPVKTTMILVLLKSIISAVLLVWTASLVKQLHQVSHINSISSVITAYIVVKIPQLVNIIVKDTDPEIKQNLLKDRIRYETFKYMNDLEAGQ